MIGWLIALGFMAIATGPAFRWLSKNKEPIGADHVFDSASGVIIWTLAALILVSYWTYSRGEKVRHACSSFEEEIRSQGLTEKQFEQIVDGRWWSICHPDMSDVQQGDQ